MVELDLNLLYVLVALDDCRSVSGTAVKLHRSQPSVSVALSRLREFFGDPLFVRTGNRMQPTPRAVSLIKSARGVLARIGSEIVAEPPFDPEHTDRPVCILLSDVGELVFLPPLLERLRKSMPKAMVRSVTLPADVVENQLETGEVDLAIGYFPDLKKQTFYQQTLCTETFAGLIRSDHPMQDEQLSLSQFQQLDHAVVRAESRTQEVIESYLARRRIQRRVVVATPHFASAPIIVEKSDLIAIVPVPLAQYFLAVSAGVRVVRLPFKPPRIALKQFWHRKVHRDERNQWLRALVYELFHNYGRNAR